MFETSKKAKMSAKAAPKIARGAGKAGLKGARSEARLARRAGGPGEPASLRLAKYAGVALVGSLAGTLLDRLSAGDGGDLPDLPGGIGRGSGAGLATRIAPKAAKGAGKVALGGAKGQARLARRALSPREPASVRVAKYAGATLVGIAAGLVLGRPSPEQD